MATFLFWNLGKQPLVPRLVRLVAAYEVDVLLLAECAFEPADLIEALGNVGGDRFHQVMIEPSKVRVFTRLEVSSLTEIYTHESERFAGYRLHLPDTPGFLLATVHLRSPAHESRDSLNHSATQWAYKLNDIEREQDHRRTILVGDLNLNPFDVGVTGAYGFHAVMTRAKALELNRRLDGEDKRFFYNPMWQFFGDRTTGPPGTYYHSSTNAVNYFWNIYDQVLVRPEALQYFDGLRILDHDGLEGLLTANGLPDSVNGSDHLPLIFRVGA